MKRFLSLLVTAALLPLMLGASPPEKKQGIPQSLIDALTKIEVDKQASLAAEAAIRIAQESLGTAVAAKAQADSALATDSAAFLKLWQEIYGPTPPTPPIPPDPPTPPDPPPPPPEPCKLRVVVLYDADALATISEPQRQMLHSVQPGSLKAWLSDNCLKTSDGWPEWRVWSTASPCSEPRYQPLVSAAVGSPAIVAQAGEGGPIKVLAFPQDAATAIAALSKIATPTVRQLHVIDDTNFRSVVGIRNNGYVKGVTPKGYVKLRSVFPVIPRSQWSALIAQGKGTFLGDLIRAAKIPCKDQDGLGYCWVYASTSCVEAIRALQGQPLVVLSPESVGGPVTGWRNRGGWGYDALEQLTKAGACRADFMDQANSLRPSRWKDGWEADCANHKITAAWATIDDDDFDGVMTAALLRLPVSIGLDWWSHQVMITGPVDLGNGKYGVEFLNSWGSSYGTDGFDVLAESKAQPSGSFACVSVGTSDRSPGATPADLVRARQKSVAKQIDQYQSAN